MISDLHTPIHLTPGERLIERMQFTPGVILQHLKVTVVLTDRRVIVQRPHTIFGFIPHGWAERSSPLESISEVMAANMFQTNRAMMGVGAALFGVWLLISGGPLVVVGLLAWAFAAFLIVSARITGLFIRNHGAGVLGAPAQGSERPLVEAMRTRIGHAVLQRADAR